MVDHHVGTPACAYKDGHCGWGCDFASISIAARPTSSPFTAPAPAPESRLHCHTTIDLPSLLVTRRRQASRQAMYGFDSTLTPITPRGSYGVSDACPISSCPSNFVLLISAPKVSLERRLYHPKVQSTSTEQNNEIKEYTHPHLQLLLF
ncbi:hypothetical protein M422DRAFT_36569 [Sphaerobolus stellatus SS14]|uniref:Uncharacterized protein n=1 Tax=Sphaerobolus stellatus (strain SS14) TaxID=990650 RepID=A0A0C9UY91_SPHS4|nr:hypothetical protein M422DRAFT_36569 [Sphaerobolus stellatus SS14]